MSFDKHLTMALKHLAVFESAVDTGIFTRAADAMATTQPSISRHISALEGILDVQLIHRLHHRVELTPAGQVLYEATKQGLEHIRHAANRIKTHQIPNTLTICYPNYRSINHKSTYLLIICNFPSFRLSTRHNANIHGCRGR